MGKIRLKASDLFDINVTHVEILEDHNEYFRGKHLLRKKGEVAEVSSITIHGVYLKGSLRGQKIPLRKIKATNP